MDTPPHPSNFSMWWLQECGSEEKAVSGEGIEGKIGEGLSGLWRTFGKCDGVRVSRKGDDLV